MKRIDEIGREIHKDLSDGEFLSVKYKSSVSSDRLREALFEKMEKSLSSEIEQGFCLYGPHREDFSVTLDNSEIKAYSSQGQIRTAVLSMKLATLRIANREFEENAVLLLDDVFSELDAERQSALLQHVKGAQCFITTAVPIKKAPAHIYLVADGHVNAKPR